MTSTGAIETLRTTREPRRPNRGPQAAAGRRARGRARRRRPEPRRRSTVCTEADELVVTFVDRYRLELARGFALAPDR